MRTAREILSNKYSFTSKSGGEAFYLKYIIDAINQARKEAIEECAEKAEIETMSYWDATNTQKANGAEMYYNKDDDVPSMLAIVNKESILKLIKDLK